MKNIGIDIDDTITITSENVKNYIINHKDEFEDANQLLNDTKHILSGNRMSNDTTKFLDEIYPCLIENVELRENVINVLNKLKEEGYKLILITARDNSYFPCGADLITIEYLRKHNVSYDILVTHSLSKGKACTDNNVDIMIDDSINGCEYLEEIGIKTLLFTTELNKSIETNISRVSNWLEIYDIIKNKYEIS